MSVSLLRQFFVGSCVFAAITCQIVLAALRQPLSTSSNQSYLTTIVNWGTPSQPLTVAVDTTFATPLVINNTVAVTSEQSTYNSGDSSTFAPQAGTFNYSYGPNTILNQCHTARDKLTIDSIEIASQSIGIVQQNPLLFSEQELDGTLGLSPNSTIISKLVSNNDAITHSVVSINVDSNELFFGDYSFPQQNATNISVFSNTNITASPIWSFKVTEFYIGVQTFGMTAIYGVIDSASPYLTVYASSLDVFNQFVHNLGGDYGSSPNCNYSTLVCRDMATIHNTMRIVVNVNDTFWLLKNDYTSSVNGVNRLLVQYGGESYDKTSLYLYFGRLLFKHRVIQLYSPSPIMTLSSAYITIAAVQESGGSTGQWATIVIVLASVICFTMLFFALFFWRNKIPRAQVRNQESQDLQSLLGGSGAPDANPIYQQYNQAANIPPNPNNPNNNNQGQYRIRGLDEDDGQMDGQQDTNTSNTNNTNNAVDNDLARAIARSLNENNATNTNSNNNDNDNNDNDNDNNNNNNTNSNSNSDPVIIDTIVNNATTATTNNNNSNEKKSNKKSGPQKLGSGSQQKGPSTAEEMRQRRLKFLEQQQLKNNDNDEEASTN